MTTYAPQANDTAETYAARLATLTGAHPIALRAAKLVAKAIQADAYILKGTEGRSGDQLEQSFDKIVGALEAIDITKERASATSDEAIKEATAAYQNMQNTMGTGGKGRIKLPSPEQTRKALVNRTAEQAMAVITKGVQGAWVELKEAQQFENPNTPNKEVVKAFYSEGKPTPASDVVQDLLALRDACMSTGKPGSQKPGKK